jgi:hypothetical protein
MIFCQSCKTANTVDREICTKCNTKLMLTAVHHALAPAGAGVGSAMEEHLLERISMLEYALARTQERFERVLELMHRQQAEQQPTREASSEARSKKVFPSTSARVARRHRTSAEARPAGQLRGSRMKRPD